MEERRDGLEGATIISLILEDHLLRRNTGLQIKVVISNREYDRWREGRCVVLDLSNPLPSLREDLFIYVGEASVGICDDGSSDQ